MKRGAFLFVLILGIVVLAACAPKPEEVNAVVTEFWTQWKAGNPAGMVATMTAEVDFGLMASDTSRLAGLSEIPNKGVPAMDLAEALVDDMPVGPSFTLSIIKTALFEEYAVVDALVDPDPSIADNEMKMILHLQNTNDGWKVCFIGFSL